nr:hypothetical protein [Crenothrix polyspora]
MQTRPVNNTLYNHRINKLVQQLNSEFFINEQDVDTLWDRPVNDVKNSFWHQNKASYLFILGCALILIAIMPTAQATANNDSFAIGRALGLTMYDRTDKQVATKSVVAMTKTASVPTNKRLFK